ncbi:uncharacterized protein LY89DRAFT_737710 [Mollisia scopiformis]|uniref:Uncharacterized protein n=1 Tax=Mollisia scopiformis TaxID=149040 RepID=A0A194WXZ9_MOLSC|nr:uncharacterized protein LY89DRAFT_737710 [Mollisia scopiformis]KUJ12800.1 hypothetical protein LY89DRAFT_737710 [Mollisia scopiformis]
MSNPEVFVIEDSRSDSENARNSRPAPSVDNPQTALGTYKNASEEGMEDTSEHKVEEGNLIEIDVIKKALEKCLNRVGTSGSFAYGRPWRDPPNPGLYLDGYGDVRFPLGPTEVQRIKTACTGIDLRNPEPELLPRNLSPPPIWQLAATEWKTGNPSWTKILAAIATTMYTQLGIRDTIPILTPSSLILQAAGSDLSQLHRPTPRSTAFGFLDVVLPSKHAGGELLLRYTFGFEQRSSVQNYPAAPVCGGVSRLYFVLTSWERHLVERKRKFLAYSLDSTYDELILARQKLVGRDQYVVSQLEDACQATGFCLFLATIERKLSGSTNSETTIGGYHLMDAVDETSCKLQHVADLDGREFSSDLELLIEERQVLVNNSCWESRQRKNEAYDKYNGQLIHWLRRQAVVIVPRSSRMSLLLGACAVERQDDITKLLQAYVLHDAQYMDEDARLDIKDLCSIAVSSSTWESQSNKFEDQTVIGALKAIIKYRDVHLFESALPLLFSKDKYFRLIETEMSRLGKDWFYARLESCVHDSRTFDLRHERMFLIYQRIRDHDWASAQLKAAVTLLASHTAEEGTLLGKMATLWQGHKDILSPMLIPLILRHARNPRTLISRLLFSFKVIYLTARQK